MQRRTRRFEGNNAAMRGPPPEHGRLRDGILQILQAYKAYEVVVKLSFFFLTRRFSPHSPRRSFKDPSDNTILYFPLRIAEAMALSTPKNSVFSPAMPADMLEMVDVYYSAFADDYWASLNFPEATRSQASKRAWLMARLISIFK